MLSRLLIIFVVVVVFLSGAFGYKSWSGHQAIKTGQDKFNQAISELHAKGLEGVCIGTSVTRKYSYSELSKKSIDEIKKLITENPVSEC